MSSNLNKCLEGTELTRSGREERALPVGGFDEIGMLSDMARVVDVFIFAD